MNLSAQSKQTTPVKAEALSRAYAVILSSYLASDLPKDAEGKKAFLEGLKDAIDNNRNKYYFYGILNGLNVVDRVDQMNGMDVPLEKDAVVDAICRYLSNPRSIPMTTEDANGMINAYVAGKIRIVPDSVSIESQKQFIDSIGALPGAVVLPSGVVMITEADATGNTPKDGDRVMVSYEGRLSDGSVFDVTEQPIPMFVGGLVPGFNDALMQMKEGATYRIVIPANQGYGERGITGVIPGNAALDFTVTLNEISN